MANKSGGTGGRAGVQVGKISSKGAFAKGSNPKNRPSKTAKSPANRAFNSMKADGARSKSTGSSGSVTGGAGGWSGASGSAGGTMGKTYGGSKVGMVGKKTAYQPNSVKSPSMTGHTAGSIRGNMMAHSNSIKPFENTGKQPPGGKIKEVSVSAVSKSNAHTPLAHGFRSDSQSKAKLQASLPYSMPSTSSWSGASASKGGMSGKTVGQKMKKGQA